jgi:hypothetical protein
MRQQFWFVLLAAAADCTESTTVASEPLTLPGVRAEAEGRWAGGSAGGVRLRVQVEPALPEFTVFHDSREPSMHRPLTSLVMAYPPLRRALPGGHRVSPGGRDNPREAYRWCRPRSRAVYPCGSSPGAARPIIASVWNLLPASASAPPIAE